MNKTWIAVLVAFLMVSCATRPEPVLPMAKATSVSVRDLNGGAPVLVSESEDVAALLRLFEAGQPHTKNTCRIGLGFCQAKFIMADGTEIAVLIGSSVWETETLQGKMKDGWKKYIGSLLRPKEQYAQPTNPPYSSPAAGSKR